MGVFSKSDRTTPLERDSILEVGEALFLMASLWKSASSSDEAARLVAELASIGGFVCGVAARHRLLSSNTTSTLENSVTVAPDGSRWIKGYLPHLYLLEDPHSYLFLALQESKASITFAAVFDTLRHVLATPDSFGAPRLEMAGMEDFRPHEVILKRWDDVSDMLGASGLDPVLFPQVLGVATRLALRATEKTLSPSIAARIVTECAIPMVRVDPEAFDVRLRAT